MVKSNKYQAIYQGKKLIIDAESQWAAVVQARNLLKVPKSKIGLLSVNLISEIENGNAFMFT